MVKRHRRRVRSLRLATAALAGALLISAQRAGAQEAKPPEPKKGWETVANVGVTLTRGNSRNFLASAGMNSSRKWPTDEILLGANAGYGETTLRQSGPDTKHTTEQYIKGFSQYNHLFNERIYGGLRVNGVYDKVAGVHYRFTVSPMAGYYLIKKPSTLLSVEVGPSFITEEVVSGFRNPAPPPQTIKRIDENSYAGARAGQRFEHKFKGGAKLWESAEWVPQVTDFDNWILNAELGVSAPITKKLDVRLVLQDTYDDVPPVGRLKNDLKLIASLAWKF